MKIMATKFINADLIPTVRRLVQRHGTHTQSLSTPSVTTNVPTPRHSNTGFLKMRGWPIHSYGDVEELQFSDNLNTPKIRCSTECLIRVRSTTVNPIDVAMLRGYGATVLNAMRCQPGPEFPLILGREFCGELAHCGMGVKKNLHVGQRVWGVVPLQRNGAHAEYVTVPEYCISPAPDFLSNEEAAAVLYAGLTAWSGLYITGHLGGLCGAMTACGGGDATKRILVLGGSGSVGSLAVQMLKSQGVQIVSTCCEDAIELVTNNGADHVVDYKNPLAMESLRQYMPYDIILDCAGQGAQYAKALNLKYNQYITFSSPLLRNIDSSGIGLGFLRNMTELLETNANSLAENGGVVKWGFFAPAPQGIEFLKKLVEQRKLLPTISDRFELAQLREAFSKVQNGHLRGKVVVNC